MLELKEGMDVSKLRFRGESIGAIKKVWSSKWFVMPFVVDYTTSEDVSKSVRCLSNGFQKENGVESPYDVIEVEHA